LVGALSFFEELIRRLIFGHAKPRPSWGKDAEEV
jgi:hypothetical protein